jgi:hypothetical protein
MPLAAPRSRSRTCYPPVGRLDWIERRTCDDDNFTFGTLSIDEELVIRNRGSHVKDGSTTKDIYTMSSYASLETGTTRMQIVLYRLPVRRKPQLLSC